MMRLLVIALSILFVAAATAPAALRGNKPDRLPRSEEPAKPGPESPPPGAGKHIFGIGVGFERTATLAGVALNIVLPDSPAFRAGLITGCIVAEINGETTSGHTGEDCARLIREAGSTVKLKILDSTMRERIITLEKQWITVPE